MIKKFRILYIVSAIIFLVTGCGRNGFIVDKEAKRQASTGESWTVMIYMSGSLQEEEYGKAGRVLENLAYDLPENINVVVETGGCRDWQAEGLRNDRIQDFAVMKNGIKLIDESLLKNMGQSDTYADFLSRTVKKYPADHYMTVIWGESGGVVSGVAQDSTYGFDSLTVPEIATGIASTGEKFDIVGFDCSMMANLETAAALSIYADYLVASEDVMPENGWDYRGLFEFLSLNPQAGGDEIGKVICDGVIGEDDGKTSGIMSVIDLSKATKLNQSFEAMSRYMSSAVSDTEVLRRIKAQTYNVQSPGANSNWEGYSNMVDLGSLARCMFNATSDDSARLEPDITKTVVYTTGDKTRRDMCGISVYYPKNMYAAEINRYREVCPSLGYMEFLDSVTASDLIENRSIDYKEMPVWQYYASVVGTNSATAQYDLTGKYILSVSNPEIISRAGVNLYKYNEESGKYIYLSTDYDTEYSAQANGYEYEFKNTQLMLNGSPVSSYLIRVCENYEIYSIPVLYGDEISSIRVVKDTENDDKFQVIGIWHGLDTETGILDGKMKTLSVGDSITPIYNVYGSDNMEYVRGKSLRIVFGGLSVTEKTIEDGDYMVTYTIDDMYGMTSETNTTNLTALKGKLKAVN